jgi:hypothetical protein
VGHVDLGWPVLAAVSAAALSGGWLAASADTCDVLTGWNMPVDLSVADVQSDDANARFAWDTFVAVCWPQDATGQPGAPDTSISICDVAAAGIPPVFLEYMMPQQAFLPDGANPGTWESPTEPKSVYGPTPESELRVIGSLTKATSIGQLIGTFDQADIDKPIIDQNGNYVLYEIYMNRSEFEWLSENGYYDANNQYGAFPVGGTPTFVGLPQVGDASLPAWAQQGAFELKTSWKQLDQDEIDGGRFFTRDVYYQSNYPDTDPLCGPVTVGLVGMHVMRLTHNMRHTWFHATFEHVDNVETNLPPPATPSFNPGPDGTCPPPYSQGYTCQASICEEPGTDDSCTASQIQLGTGPNVCDANPDETINISRITEMTIPAVVASVNTEYQDELPAPWKYYELINTIHPEDNGPCCIQPLATNTISDCWMTNTTMESYTQYFPTGDISGFAFPKCGSTTAASLNCTDCHAAGMSYGAPVDQWGFPEPTAENPDGTKYQIFTFLLFHAEKSCPSDVTYDGDTNADDIIRVVDDWACEGTDCTADADQSGAVNISDLLTVLNGWGSCGG